MSITNTQLLAHLSENAKVGPVIQMVLITALDNYSKSVLQAEPGFLGAASKMVSEGAWRSACQEIQDTLNNRDKISVPEFSGDAAPQSLISDMLSMLQDLHNNFGWDELTTTLEDVQQRAADMGLT